MPGISDPGYVIVQAAVEAGVKVVPIPGELACIAGIEHGILMQMLHGGGQGLNQSKHRASYYSRR